MIINKPSILKEMMRDMKKAPDIYQPGNFWMFYVDKIAKDLEKKDLNKFRNWICGPGSIKSFGGGRDLYGMKYGSNIHPFSDIFIKFDRSFIIKYYNAIINKISKFIPALGIFSFRSSIARNYFEDNLKSLQDSAWIISKLHDENQILNNVEDSKEGDPYGFTNNNKFYTVNFLKEMMQIFFIEKHVRLKNLNVVLEIGAGIGLKASAFLKINPNLTYIIIDIPPALYLSQQYLISQNYKVFTYNDAKKIKSLKEINLRDFNVICLAPWMIDLIFDNSVDIFINVFSFQEMEPYIVENYLNKISRITKNYIYMVNLKKGHFVAEKKKKHGVLKQVTTKNYMNFLSGKFELKSERDHTSIFGIEKNSSELFFTKLNQK